MKCAIIYFSSTGITPRFGSEIAKVIKEKIDCHFDFIRIKKGRKIDLSKYDLIGIGAPCYSFRAPRLMTRLLRRMDFHKKPFFVYATYNSRPGNTMWNVYRAVKRKAGICLGYTQGSIAVNIRAWLPKKKTDKKLKEITEKTITQAVEFGKIISERYKLITSNEDYKQNPLWKPPVKPLVVVWSLFFTWSWEMLCTVGIKRVDKKKCTRCKICAEVICPSKSIRLSKDNTPRFAEIYCVGCNGCVNLCPYDAIWTFQTKNRKPYNLYKEYILRDSNKWFKQEEKN